MDLHQFLLLEHRFQWGGLGFTGRDEVNNDCFTFPASWVQRLTGIDVARSYRGTYSTKEEADAIIAAAGGVVELAGRQLELVSAKRVQFPQDGDVGIVEVPQGEELKMVGAIRFGPLWAVLTPGRVIAKKLDHVAAWRVPACA